MKRLFPLIILIVLLLVGFLTKPAYGQISVRSPLSDDRYVEPGTSYEGAILIKNETDQPQQAKIYQTDYLFFFDGSNYYGDPGSTHRSNAPWVQFSPTILNLPPGQMLAVNYLVDVPDDFDDIVPEGSYWSMLMVEAIPQESMESTLSDLQPDQHGVRQVMRYGIQVASHIRGSGRGEIEFINSNLLEEEDESTLLRLDLENVGTMMVRPNVWVELYDENGTLYGRKEAPRSRIYPGTSVQKQINLGILNAGTYKALVVVDAGEDDLFGAEYQFEIL